MLKESQTFSYAIAGGGTLKLEIANYYETCYNFQMNANWVLTSFVFEGKPRGYWTKGLKEFIACYLDIQVRCYLWREESKNSDSSGSSSRDVE